MTDVTPVSLLTTPGKILGQIAGDIAESAQGEKGLAGAFSDAWMGLDANKDGTLNGKDVLSHAKNARDAVLQGLADSFGYDTSPAARARRAAADSGADPKAQSNMGNAASRAAECRTGTANPPVQILLASAPPALPSAPAARAVENLPGVEQIRATYAALRHRT